MYNKVDSKLDLPKLDKEVLDFWDKDNTFKKSVEQRKGQKPFVFFDGPPGVNGLPHIGHCINRVFKDLVLRYKTMKGFYVERQAGWDTHGLPVELKAEQDLGIKNKQELEKFGMENFINKCKEVMTTYEKVWVDTSKLIGFWIDMDKPYMTCDQSYIESVWWSLKEMFDRGLIVKGYRVAPYCDRCGTSLAEHEVAQGHKEVTDKTLYVKFKSKDFDGAYYVAWTTTPWTLPSNVALCVNKDAQYDLVEANGEKYILASSLVKNLFEDSKVLQTFKGQDLIGKEYFPLYDLPESVYENKKCFFITSADYVTLTDGTGIVHIAPAFGEEDYNVGKDFNLPVVKMVDEAGKFKDGIKYAGMHRREANEQIIADLKEEGKALKVQTITHVYPHCWRCKSPLMYYAREGWFITMSGFRKELTNNNNDVCWHPENAKEGRMGKFLEDAHDWNLSRDRFWSTPLNIWECKNCNKTIAIGSIQELKEKSGIKEDIELHRPYIDKVTIPCECGSVMKRVPQVIDVWYESGAMPFASLHYPFENQEKFKERAVADFIVEGQDQTRGWFYSLQAISTVLFDRTPYKHCVMTGVALDKNGIKMSKSLGNVVDAVDVCQKYGADAFRWFFASNAFPWQSASFDETNLQEVQRKIIGTLWNTYSFYVLYANIDDFEGGSIDLKTQKLTVMDKWILSEYNSLVESVTKNMDDFNWTQATRDIEIFVDKLSNWYVRRCRERFWVDGNVQDKFVAFETLYEVLIGVVKLVAPVMPFLAENIYQNLTHGKNSVHLEDYPVCDQSFINKELEEQMQEIIKIVDLARTVRATTNLKTRQPLPKMLVHTSANIALTDEEIKIIADDINVKEVLFIENPEEYLNFELKPQLKTLGPRYGKRLNEIREFLASCDSSSIVQKLQNGELVDVAEDITIGLDDVLIYTKSKDKFCADSSYGITVVLDTTLTEDLICEGHMREIISKLQNMRKDSGFEVEDEIEITYDCGEELEKVIQKTKSEIQKVTLAKTMEKAQNDGEEIDINGMKATFKIKKVK